MEPSCNLIGIGALASRLDSLAPPLLTALIAGLALVAAPETRASLPSPAEADADTPSCGAAFDPLADYTGLPEVTGPDVSGEAGIELWLQDDRGVARIDDCLYTLDRPLRVDFAGLDQIELIVELPDAGDLAEVFTTQDGALVDLVEVHAGSFQHTLTPAGLGATLGFEIRDPALMLPTSPVIEIERPPPDPQPQ